MTRLAIQPLDLAGRFIFLSAGFPSGDRATQYVEARPDDVADAVVAIARGVLTGRGRLVFGGHPTISPLVLMVAAEYSTRDPSRVTIYQSRLFASRVTDETLRLEREGYGTIRWTEAVPGDSPEHGLEHLASLEVMRIAMLSEVKPVAAFFVGGMEEGITLEYMLARDLLPRSTIFCIAGPGGAAAGFSSVGDLPESLAESLRTSRLYPAVVDASLRLVAERPG
jgi:hypothetical protein